LALTVPLATTVLPLAQYVLQVFLSPFSFFGRRKIKKWGVAYDALTKEPLDLVIVRLVDEATGKIVQTRVTGADGKYGFLVDPQKKYRLEIKKSHYQFPSKYLAGVKKDEVFSDLYYGEDITFADDRLDKKREIDDEEVGTEYGYIARDIPLDPVEGQVFVAGANSRSFKSSISTLKDYSQKTFEQIRKENEKILRHNLYRKITKFISYLGPVLSFISYLITPSKLFLFLIFFNVLILVIFRRLGEYREKMPYGQVFDLKNKKNIPRAVVRLFDPKYGRLVSAKVTDNQGRYGFLAKQKEYVLTCEKEKYHLPNKKMTVKPKEGVVNRDLGLEEVKRKKNLES
ncbi:hypothetical protein KKC60_01330, partial [Patescibacteria group bacterium]|nr:hypothetical protein [Patescibacteria group bacterium]